jgi:5-oxoprolinase (ATP-hydrolysing)
MARALGIERVFVHRYCSVLSAYGIALADVVRERQEPCALVLGVPDTLPEIHRRLDALRAVATADLVAQHMDPATITTEAFLHLRYHGTDFGLMVPEPPATADPDTGYEQAFVAMYAREFGFTLPERRIYVDDVRVRATARTPGAATRPAEPTGHTPPAERSHAPVATVSVYFDGGRRPTPLYRVEDLRPEVPVAGPALVLDPHTTIVVEPYATVQVTADGDVLLHVQPPAAAHTDATDSGAAAAAAAVRTAPDPIQLAIFGHRFMSIAEQMGRTLQRTAISTNIKERLDFSCALFAPDGGLVANAPHIPVHLGAMQEAVRYQLRTVPDLADGDVLLSNHPQAGGSHLPDMTVITPVFDGPTLVFFVASRGHHADIGGIAPGSMPPLSRELYQEGACIRSFKLVRGGQWQQDGIVGLLEAPGALPGCAPTRNIPDVLSDLRAQVAANHRGIALVRELIHAYGRTVVHAYMHHIQANAEAAVRTMLRAVAARQGSSAGRPATLHAADAMDDGTPIVLTVTIDPTTGDAHFDFTGTGLEVYGNCNAPPAVTYSAIIYCLRCLVADDIPLNQGCLAPVTVHIPPGSILCPSETAAVVGGNVLTSQRVTDVILKGESARCAPLALACVARSPNPTLPQRLAPVQRRRAA